MEYFWDVDKEWMMQSEVLQRLAAYEIFEFEIVYVILLKNN
jgi:hypothetical protein